MYNGVMKLSENLTWTALLKPFRIVAAPYSVKNGLSLVGVPRYASLVFTVFSASMARLWIAIGFQTVSKRTGGQ